VNKGFWYGVLTLAVAACATRPTSTPREPPTSSTEPPSAAALVAAIEADAKRSDHEPDSKVRGELAAEADRESQACLAREPQTAPCLYGRGIALGLEARAHPTHAGESLSNMLAALGRAETADPNYDEAGPARVRALVLIRAPGWPLGPGDAEAGLAAARRAVSLRPLYPPNLLALAEALAKTGDGNSAREYYTRAHDAALALPAAVDRDEWLREAEQGLQLK
jgi:tetratricopeptide (TPR) repeat protein